MQMQQDAEDAGHAGAGGTQAGHAGIQSAAGTADQTADKGLKVAQVDTEDGGLGNAHAGRKGGGQGHRLNFGVLALEGNGKSGTALGNVGGTGQGQPVGEAKLGQLAKVDQGVHMVDTGHNGDGVQTAHDEGTDAERQLDQGLNAVDDAVLQRGEDWADDSEGEITGNENGDQRGNKQVDHGGHNFVQPLFNLAHQPHGNDNGDNVALVADQRNFVQPAKHRLVGLHALRSNGPGVLQVGVNHDHADDSTQELVATKHLCGGEGDQDRQEGVRRVGEQLGKHIDGTAGINVQEAVVDHKVQRFHNAHQKAGSHDGRDDGNKDIAQRLDGPLVPRRFGSGSLFDFLLAGTGDSGQGGELVIHLVHNAGAEDDLQLALGFKYALGALSIFKLFFVHLGIIRNHQAQAGCAVCGRYNVGSTADVVQHLLGCFLVIHVARSFFYLLAR